MTHYRNGPGIDVAMCGARGAHVSFSKSSAGVTCDDCKERRLAVIGNGRAKREAAARAAYFKTRGFA